MADIHAAPLVDSETHLGRQRTVSPGSMSGNPSLPRPPTPRAPLLRLGVTPLPRSYGPMRRSVWPLCDFGRPYYGESVQLGPSTAGPPDLPAFDYPTFPRCRVPYPGRPSHAFVRFFCNGIGLRLFLRGSALSKTPANDFTRGKPFGAADIPSCYGPQVRSPSWSFPHPWQIATVRRGLCHLSLPEIRSLLPSQVSYPIEPDNYRSRTLTGWRGSFSGCTGNLLLGWDALTPQ